MNQETDEEVARYSIMNKNQGQDQDIYREFEDPRRYMFILDLQKIHRNKKIQREEQAERRRKLHNLEASRQLRESAKDPHKKRGLKILEEELERINEENYDNSEKYDYDVLYEEEEEDIKEEEA